MADKDNITREKLVFDTSRVCVTVTFTSLQFNANDCLFAPLLGKLFVYSSTLNNLWSLSSSLSAHITERQQEFYTLKREQMKRRIKTTHTAIDAAILRKVLIYLQAKW